MSKEKTIYDRTALLIGEDGINRLQRAHIAVAGVGGVGSFCVEALARAGVGTLTLIDNDTVDITNLNRQIHANMDTIGQQKTEVMKQRLLQIRPDMTVYARNEFLLPDNISEVLDGMDYDYIIDAVDTVSAKLALILHAKQRQIPVISCMGTANKLDATRFEVTDISKTHTCPLARIMRQELRKRGIDHGVEVLYSTALPVYQPKAEEGKKAVPGSISYVPPVAGMLLAGHVIQKLLK